MAKKVEVKSYKRKSSVKAHTRTVQVGSKKKTTPAKKNAVVSKTKPKELNFSDLENLKKGQKIQVHYFSPIKGDTKTNFIIKSRSLVNKGKVRETKKITLVNPKNPNGFKSFLYNRKGEKKYSFALGDLGTMLRSIKLID